MMDRTPLDVLDAIHSTRAMRYLKPDPIPDEVLWEILDAAICGPTGGNMQGWGWIIVRDPSRKREIGEWYLGYMDAMYGGFNPDDLTGGQRAVYETGSGTATWVARRTDVGVDDRNYRAAMHLAHHLADVPAIVFPVLRGGGPLSSILGAVQNLMLAARAFGIGSVLVGGPPHADELLGLPQGVSGVNVMVPLGYPARGDFSQPRRRPVEEVVHWERWGEQTARPAR